MAITSDPFTASDLAAYIPEEWTPLVLEEYFAKAVAANFFTDLAEFAEDGGDILHVPGVFTNAMSVGTQSTQGAEITTASPAADDVTLTINLHKYVAILMGDKDMRQVARSYNLNGIYAKKAAGTLLEDLETALLALWSGLSTNSVGDTATVLSDAEVRRSIEKLATADVPLEECAWFIHPYVWWNQLLAVQKYYDASQRGKGAPVADGNFGNADAMRALKGPLYDIPVYTSSKVASGLQTYRNLLAHKNAFGFAHQTPSANGYTRVQSDYWLANLGLLTVIDTIYGVTEMRDDLAVVVNASSSFIGS